MSDQKYDLDAVNLSDAEQKIRKRRNNAIGLILGAIVVMFFIATLVQMGGSVANRAF